MARVQNLGISARQERRRDTSVLGEMRDEWNRTYFGSRDDITNLADIPRRAVKVAKGAYRDFRYGGVGDGVSRAFTGGNIDDPWTWRRTIHTGLVLAPMLRAGHGLVMAAPNLARIPGASAGFQIAERMSGAASRVMEAAPHAMSAVATPARWLANKLFQIEAPAIGTGERFVFDSAYAYLENDLFGRAYEALSEKKSSTDLANGKATGVGTKPGDGVDYVERKARTPEQIDLPVMRELTRKAYAKFDSDGDKAALASDLAKLRSNTTLWNEMLKQNFLEYYSKQHGSTVAGLYESMKTAKDVGDVEKQKELKEILGANIDNFRALPERTRHLGGY